jgi:hypothetical protein
LGCWPSIPESKLCRSVFLIVEKGVYTDGGSYLNVDWDSANPIIEQPLVLTDEMVVHSFGIVMNRGLVGTTDTITVTQQLYGISIGNNSAAPSSADFAIRCRLFDFETENVTPAKGWVSYAVLPSATALDGVTAAQAVISSD